MSLVKTELRNSAAPAPLTVTSPMCEMSKIPAAWRTARCSSVMLVYCTGISQPPKSISLAPNFWCAEKSAVRCNMNFLLERIEPISNPQTSNPQAGWDQPARSLKSRINGLSPFLRLHLFLRRAQFKDQPFGEFHQRIRAAGVKNRVRQIGDMRFHESGVNPPVAPRPIIRRQCARTGHENLKLGFSISNCRNSLLKMMSFGCRTL